MNYIMKKVYGLLLSENGIRMEEVNGAYKIVVPKTHLTQIYRGSHDEAINIIKKFRIKKDINGPI